MSDDKIHPLLAEQLRLKLPGVDVADPALQDFIASVNDAYARADEERESVERKLDLVSKELTQANERIREDAENRLNQLTRYYAQTLDLQKGLLLCFRRDEDGGYIHTLCRGQLSQNMGFQPERVEGHRLDKILRGPVLRRMTRLYNAAWAGKIRTLEGGSKRRGVKFLAVFHPRLEDGKVIEMIVSAMEITDLKNTESELRAAKLRAESADKAKSDFLAVMSHEIRTPMNSVIGFTSLLRTSELTEEQEQYVKMIETSGEGLLEIINDVLDISKIEAGRMELSMEAVDVTVLAHEVAALMTSRADEKGVLLEVCILNDIPEEVNTDRARLRQILINLVGNALKFTAKGSVTLEMSYGPGTELHFKVIDTGIGIPEESMERLFKPFSQADSSTTRDFGGTGLGLAICKRLSEAMGGDISVASDPGQGSCFSFHVDAPRAESPIAALVEEENHPVAAAKDPTDNPAILVVDDNPINRKVLGSILRVSGYERVAYAFDGAQALAAARKNLPDIVFMDVEMPVMDGMTATTEIRRLPTSTAQRPWIIGLSANVWAGHGATIRRSGDEQLSGEARAAVRCGGSHWRAVVIGLVSGHQRSTFCVPVFDGECFAQCSDPDTLRHVFPIP